MFRPLDDRRRCSSLIVALILLLAIGLRIGWAISRPTDDAALANLPDQVEYLSLGKSLRAGNGLQMVDPRFNDTVYAFRMPGYPLLCAILDNKPLVIRLVQSVVDASTVLATLWLARRWLTPTVAYLAALAVALDPIGVYFSSLILSETLFAALLTWGIACLAHGRSPMSRGGGALWWVGIVVLILSICVRPSALILPVLLAGAAVIHEHGSDHFKAGPSGSSADDRRAPHRDRAASVGDPKSCRRWQWVFTTTNSGFTLYDAWNADASGASDQSGLARLPLLSGLSETQRSRYLSSLALKEFQQDPLRIVAHLPRNLCRLWSPWPLSAEFGAKRHYVLAAGAHAIPLFVLALVGLLLRRSISRSGKWLLLTPILVLTISHGFTLGSLRYRMPIHPELAVLAASALAWQGRISRGEVAGEAT